jgi:hypothetical protein
MAVNLDHNLEQLIMGKLKYQSSNLGLNLLISRLQKKYSAGQTSAELSNCLQEMKAFFDKYKLIMTKEAEAIQNL